MSLSENHTDYYLHHKTGGAASINEKPTLSNLSPLIYNIASNASWIAKIIANYSSVSNTFTTNSLTTTRGRGPGMNVDLSDLDGDIRQKEFVFDRTDVRIIFVTLYSLVFGCCFFGKCLLRKVEDEKKQQKTEESQ